MPLPDVAASLGIPLGTAKSRLHHALAAMRRSTGIAPEPAPAPVPGGQVA
jgi:DNA-directed RNA polymerase specialized sigma24 family protein